MISLTALTRMDIKLDLNIFNCDSQQTMYRTSLNKRSFQRSPSRPRLPQQALRFQFSKVHFKSEKPQCQFTGFLYFPLPLVVAFRTYILSKNCPTSTKTL